MTRSFLPSAFALPYLYLCVSRDPEEGSFSLTTDSVMQRSPRGSVIWGFLSGLDLSLFRWTFLEDFEDLGRFGEGFCWVDCFGAWRVSAG